MGCSVIPSHVVLPSLLSFSPFVHYGFGFISQVCSPVQSEKQAPRATVWDVADSPPETQPGVVSREEAGSLHSGHQEQLTPKRELRPLPKNGKNSDLFCSPTCGLLRVLSSQYIFENKLNVGGKDFNRWEYVKDR